MVGLLILHKLTKNAPMIDFDLYRDDGLGESKPMSGPKKGTNQKENKAISMMRGK